MISEIVELYEKTKNPNKFFLNLNKKRNAKLKEEFNDVFNKTVYFKNVKKAKLQALYNILNGIDSIQTYADGGLKIFKNFEEGYFTEEEYNEDMCPMRISKINDLKYMVPALHHLKLGSWFSMSRPIVKEALKAIFKEDLAKISNNSVISYLISKNFKPVYCKYCR